MIRAAGGVVWRRSPDGEIHILLVSRAAYGDWSLPKGKLEDGEDDEAAAVREVEEETGLRCPLGEDLGTISYTDHRGRPKTVRYYAMEVTSGEAAAANEVAAIRWIPIRDAGATLTFPLDAEVVARFSPPEGM